MNKDHTKQIHEAGPTIFPAHVAMECGDGWFDLILNLVKDIEALVVEYNLDGETHMRVSQVKEKYGTLSFYMSTETDSIGLLIDKAEQDSAQICERCGKTGTIYTKNRWVKTRCPDCRKQEDAYEH